MMRTRNGMSAGSIAARLPVGRRPAGTKTDRARWRKEESSAPRLAIAVSRGGGPLAARGHLPKTTTSRGSIWKSPRPFFSLASTPVESSLVYSARRWGERDGGEADTWPDIEVRNWIWLMQKVACEDGGKAITRREGLAFCL